MIYVGLVILGFMTWFFPAKGKIIAVAINLFIRDPLPFVDEVIMLVGLTRMTDKNLSFKDKVGISFSLMKQVFRI